MYDQHPWDLWATRLADQGSGSREDEDNFPYLAWLFRDVDEVKDAQNGGFNGKVWENLGKILEIMGRYGKIWKRYVKLLKDT